jgi:hypothetical protein
MRTSSFVESFDQMAFYVSQKDTIPPVIIDKLTKEGLADYLISILYLSSKLGLETAREAENRILGVSR